MIEFHAASVAAHEQRPNEDAYACIEDFAVVADGATAPATLNSGCSHDPRWYAKRLVTCAALAHVMNPEAPLPDTLSRAIESTTKVHADSCDTNHPGTPSATVVMFRSSRSSLQWLVLGDATLVLELDGDLQVVTDQRLGRTSQREREAVLAGGNADGLRAERIAALSQAQRRFRNVPGGFWVAAADPTAAYHSLTGELSIGPSTSWRAALLTDGASAAVDTYTLTDWGGALDAMAKSGPSDFLRAIRAVEASDPDASVHPRIKPSDDATAIYVAGESSGVTQ